MKWIFRTISKAYDKKIDGTGLALFRIFYCLVLLFEISQFFYFKELMFDEIPFIIRSEISFAIPIIIWFISVLMIMIGCFTRFFTIINYLFSLVLIGSISTYEYHVFYAYMGVNFLMIFLPVSNCLSLDRVLKKLKYSNTTFQYNPSKKVSQLSYFSLAYLALALIYFDSVFFKFDAPSWQTGLGLWMPSSLPMMVHINFTPLLNIKLLMVFLGYLTLLFEAIFIFTFFRKKFRLILAIVGILLHVGIFMVFPIPWFALTYISLYLLLIPVSFWERLRTVFVSKSRPKLFFFYDAECPLCLRTKLVIEYLDLTGNIEFKTVQFDSKEYTELEGIGYEDLLDNIYSLSGGIVYKGVDTYIRVFSNIWYLYPLSCILRVPGLYHLSNKIYNFIAVNRTTERCTDENCGYNPPSFTDDKDFKILQNLTLYDLKKNTFALFLVTVTVIQLLYISTSPTVTNLKQVLGFDGTMVDKAIRIPASKLKPITKTFLGLTDHNVFYDYIHYHGYSHIIAIVYKDSQSNEVWLPLIDKNGQPGVYNYGTNWRKMSFSTNSANINTDELHLGIRDFTAFWAKKNNVDLNKARFNIKVKKIDSPNGWEKDFLNKQIAKPWMSGGYVLWENERMTSYIKDIESL